MAATIPDAIITELRDAVAANVIAAADLRAAQKRADDSWSRVQAVRLKVVAMVDDLAGQPVEPMAFLRRDEAPAAA